MNGKVLSTGGMILTGEKRGAWRKTHSSATSPSQIPHKMKLG